MNESSSGLAFAHTVSRGKIQRFRLFAVALLLALIGLSALAASSRAADHTITIDHARFSLGVVFPDSTIIPADVPGPLDPAMPNASANGSIKVSVNGTTATVATGDFKLPVVWLPNPVDPGAQVPILLSTPDGLSGTFDSGSGELALSGALRIGLVTGVDGQGQLQTCQIDVPNMSWSTAPNAVYPGVSFASGLAGDGAIAVAWSDLPDGSEVNGGDCSTVNAIIHDTGAIWLSSGIANPPSAPICEYPLEGLWPDCHPGQGGPAPANDNFADAAVLAGDSAQASGTTVGASFQTGEPDHYGSGASASVWFQWTPTQSGTAVIDVCDVDWNTGSVEAVAAYTGASLGNLSEVGSGYCMAAFQAAANVTYRIAVASYSGRETSFTLKASVHQPPANDNFASAEVLTGNSVQVSGSTTAATIQANEPDHYGSEASASVWYQWTPTQSGTAVINVCDYSGDLTAVVAYTGTALANLSEVGSSYCGASFRVTANVTYRIAVASYSGAGASFTLKAGIFQPPANDNFADATVITGNPASLTANNAGASHEAGEPDHGGGGGGGSLWYRWTAPGSGSVTVDTCGSDFDTYLAAYTGSALANLSLVKRDDDSCGMTSQISFAVSSGTTYSIAVDGYNSTSRGSVNLNLAFTPTGGPAQFNLATYISGNGTGRVTSSPAGIDCGSDCSESYADGTVVTLTAAAGAGSSFAGWSGACSGASASCQVTMSQARTVTAAFTKDPVPPANFTLTVNRSGDGQGRVTSSPAGIDCGSDCSESYVDATAVTLTAAADTGSEFSGWTGACSGSSASCQVTMSQARNVTATFVNTTPPPASFELAVAKSGDGQGRVTSSPTGIDCGSDCSESFDDGTVVTLTAAADTGSTFSGWTGACSGMAASCEVSMDQARSVTASFWSESTPPPPPTAAKVGRITAARKGKVKRGKKATIKVKVTNIGGKTLKGKLKIRSSNRQVKAPKSARLNVRPGKTQTIKVKVKASKKARGKAKITFSAGGKKAVTALTVKK